MPNPPAEMSEQSEPELREAALAKLRLGTNPFQLQVATVGTASESLLASVPEFAAGQFADILSIIQTYRDGSPPTRVYPVLGDRGSGKTHLRYRLEKELRDQTVRSGDETMLVVVESLSAGLDPIDYLLWQIVNHLLAQGGDGERMLDVVAGRVTGKLLAEALRRLAPHQRIALFPVRGLWDRLRRRLGSQSRVEKLLAAVESVIQVCSRKTPTPTELRECCQAAGLPLNAAQNLVEQHLRNVESKDILGWFRRELFGRLARLALLSQREPFEDLHSGEYQDAPPNVKEAGNQSRRLLETWLQLLRALDIPVVIMFDQLEDFLRSTDHEEEITNRKFFTNAMALFVNELRSVCIVVFAERGFWTDLITRAEPYTAERLQQPFGLPGRPSVRSLDMPDHLSPSTLGKLVQQRVRAAFPDLSLTGLPTSFPFTDNKLQILTQETSVRDSLRRLAKQYDEIVFPIPPPPRDLPAELAKIWKEQLKAAKTMYGADPKLKVSSIPEVQNALHAWLDVLKDQEITGAGSWKKLEFISYPDKQPHGNMSVIRPSAVNVPGIGIAVWLGRGPGQPADLAKRISFFDANPCKIKTLVMLRSAEDFPIGGRSWEIYEEARSEGRDVRLHPYEPKHLHALMAFLGWHQAALPIVEEIRGSSPNADQQFRDFLTQLSSEILGWIDSWRKAP
ncbi:hypothetical protein BH10PLA2_BH10PLA2_05890 [soil metagenome]